MDWDGRTANQFPVMSNDFPRGVTGVNYTCGFMDGTKSGAALPSRQACSVAAGSTVTSSWWHGAIQGEDPKVDSFIHNSHHGPFIVYMAKWENNGGLPTAPVWFKVHELGVTKDNRDFWLMEWASPHVMNQNGGGLSFTVPSQLKAGRYLVRFEIIALHDAIKQPYIRCADFVVTGSGTVEPTTGLIAIPGSSIPLTDPGFTYDMYQQDGKRPAYPIPGPRPFNFTTAATTAATSTTRQLQSSLAHRCQMMMNSLIAMIDPISMSMSM
jgi:cellulase